MRERGVAALIAGVLAVLLVSRIVSVDMRWRNDNIVYAEIDKGMENLPPGKRIAIGYPVSVFDNSSQAAMAAYTLPVWNVARHGGFPQPVFTIPTQQPLVMRPHYRQLADSAPQGEVWTHLAGPNAGGTSSRRRALLNGPWKEYDGFIIVMPASTLKADPNGQLKLVYRVCRVAIYEKTAPASHQ